MYITKIRQYYYYNIPEKELTGLHNRIGELYNKLSIIKNDKEADLEV